MLVMGIQKPKALFYVTIRDIKTRPQYKTRNLTVYCNGVPNSIDNYV